MLSLQDIYIIDSELPHSHLSFEMGKKARKESGEDFGKSGRPTQPLTAAPKIVDPMLAALFSSSVNHLQLRACETYC